MAPIKLEDNFREKLEERELQPSANAWSKLEATLPVAEKQGKNTFFWYAIAASFVGILIIASVFFNETKKGQLSNEIVVEDVVDEINETPNKDFVDQEIVPVQAADKVQIEIASEEVTTKKKIQTTQVQKAFRKPLKTNTQEESISSEAIAKVIETSVKQKDETPFIKNVRVDENDPMIKTQIDKVVAQVQAMEQTNVAITAEEINDLLAAAQKEIQTQRILSRTKVDAAALLQDVENDLERSFRDKVFDALGDSYSIIRTAVVERNN